MRLSKALPEVTVVVKLHRKDRLEDNQQGLTDCAASKLIVVAEEVFGFPRDIFDWLQGCRLVLTGASAVAVEAMLMDVPVVTMDFCDEIQAVDFIDAGATCHVRTADALIERASSILNTTDSANEERSRAQAYLAEAFYALDGRSAARGAAALHALIANTETT